MRSDASPIPDIQIKPRTCKVSTHGNSNVSRL